MERDLPNDDYAEAMIVELKSVPAEVVETVVALSVGTGRPNHPEAPVRAALADWRGDVEAYALERLGAVAVDPPEPRRILLAGENRRQPEQAPQGVPFLFRGELPLFPREVGRYAPEFEKQLLELPAADARAHLERAMAIAVWNLMRVQFDASLAKWQAQLDKAFPTGVDVIWQRHARQPVGRPRLELLQDTSTLALLARARMSGLLVAKAVKPMEGPGTLQ